MSFEILSITQDNYQVFLKGAYSHKETEISEEEIQELINETLRAYILTLPLISVLEIVEGDTNDTLEMIKSKLSKINGLEINLISINAVKNNENLEFKVPEKKKGFLSRFKK